MNEETLTKFKCIRCGRKVKVQIIGELLEKICGKCWCEEVRENVRTIRTKPEKKK